MTNKYVNKYLAIFDDSYMKRTKPDREITPDWFLDDKTVVVYPYNILIINKYFEYIHLTKAQYLDVILQNRLITHIYTAIDKQKFPWDKLNILSQEESFRTYKKLIKEYLDNEQTN